MKHAEEGTHYHCMKHADGDQGCCACNPNPKDCYWGESVPIVDNMPPEQEAKKEWWQVIGKQKQVDKYSLIIQNKVIGDSVYTEGLVREIVNQARKMAIEECITIAHQEKTRTNDNKEFERGNYFGCVNILNRLLSLQAEDGKEE